MKDRGQIAFEAYNQPGCHWAFQSAGERARWAAVECAVLFRAPPIGDTPELRGAPPEQTWFKADGSVERGGEWPGGTPARKHWPDCILGPDHYGECHDGY